MALAIFDSTCSVICLGRFISKAFLEQLGVREGAVESPHQFNMYISSLRQCLEEEHNNRCRMLGVIISVLLYADDAALPADTPEALQKSAEIFERFCNDHRLYISTPKSFITVFHDVTDTQVQYHDGHVYVDGQAVAIHIYGTNIAAVSTLKYLGVVFDEFGSPTAHMEARTAAFLKAAYLLLTGLRRLPGYTHDFLMYLWRALVMPVASYGMEVFAFPDASTREFLVQERAMFRRLLGVGGRAPSDTVAILMGVDSCVLDWRAKRLGHFLRLLSSPVGSLEHMALSS